jgi:hypothetical protein
MSRRTVRGRLAAALGVAAFALASTTPAFAGLNPEQIDAAPPASIAVEHGRLSVEVRDADLGEVLQEIAERAGFHLTATGRLGRVTASFSGVPIEEGLRRVAPDCELMLVYQAPDAKRADQRLVDVRVFAGSPSNDPVRAAAALAEIGRLVQTRANPSAIARLTELLGVAPDASVRSRAAWALGRAGGRAAESALTMALSDQAADVRIQVLHALQLVEGVRAIQAFQSLLLRDPDARVRLAAARALEALPTPSAMAALSAAASDADPSVRREVAAALQRRSALAPR